MTKLTRQLESLGMTSAFSFANTTIAISIFLGLYQLLGLESVLPAELTALAAPLAPWWFLVFLAGIGLRFFNKLASRMPAIAWYSLCQQGVTACCICAERLTVVSDSSLGDGAEPVYLCNDCTAPWHVRCLDGRRCPACQSENVADGRAVQAPV